MATLIIEVDDRQAKDALRKLSISIDITAKKAERGFGGAGNKIAAIAGPLGIATAGVAALSAAFVVLATEATKEFIDVTAKAIELNKEAELTRLSLIQIFEGNEKAADAFIDTIGDLAIRLGTSRQELTGLAKGILPDVGGIQDTADLLENVIVLGRDAGQGIDSIRIATEEALSGNLASLGRRLNIPKATLDNIKEYQEEMDLAAAINRGLSERIAETGISADVTADSLATLQGRIEGTFEGFQRTLGESPFEELKEQAKDFLLVLEDQQQGIDFVTGAFGDLAANVIEFIGAGLTDFVASLDFEAIERLVDSFNRALAAGQLVLDVLFDIPETGDLLIELTVGLEKTRASLVAIAVVLGKVKNGFEVAFLAAKALFQLKTGNITAALESIANIGEVASLENQQKTAENAEMAFERYRQTLDNIDESQEKRRDTTDQATQADIDAGEAILANKKALDELADAQAEAAKAQDEINEKFSDLEEERQKRLTDIIRKESDRRFDDAVKAAQQREDIARDNVEAIEDIFRKQGDAIADAGKDLNRDEQDIARKGARARRQIERESANQRLDIERDFRQELNRIQTQFNQDAQEAERNNDAQAFLQAVRARDQQVQAATVERDESVGGAERDAEQQRQALKVQLAEEVKDAKISNQRKLEDLQTRLERELQAQAIKNERDIQEQGIKEQRLKEQRDLAAQRELEDFTRKEAEKEAKLNESLAKQFEAIQRAKELEIEFTARAEAEKTRIVKREADKRRAIVAAAEEARARAREKEDARPFTPGGGGRIQGGIFMQEGGRARAGRATIVGEAGPEVFVPDTAGTIIPNDAIFSPPQQSLGSQQISRTSIANNPTFNLAENMFTDPIARRQLANFVLEVLSGVS